MHTPLLRFSYHLNRLFSVSIRRETRATRSIAFDLKPGISFSGLIFVRDFSWKRSNVGFGRNLLGGFASMAFSGSGGNGGSGKSDGNSGKRGDGEEDGNGSNLVGSWSLPEEKWKDAILFTLWKLLGIIKYVLCASTPAIPFFIVHLFEELLTLLFASVGMILIFEELFGLLTICLAAAWCIFVYFYRLKQLRRFSEENTSNPPDNVECCICISTYEGMPVWRSLPCNHWFHSSCINSWIRINPTCPICKRDAYITA